VGLHSERVERRKTTLETSDKDVKLHPKRVGKMWDYTRNEWKDVKLHSKRVERRKTTLETSDKDVKLHSKRVERRKITLETSGEDVHFQEYFFFDVPEDTKKKVEKQIHNLLKTFINEFGKTATVLWVNLLHIFSTRFECSLTSFLLVRV
jgi:hypothetical protein